MPGLPTRRSTGVRAGAVALSVLALTGVSLTGAVTAAAAPGDSGDIAIHKAGTAPSDPRDETKVCKFGLSAFNFETVKAATWTITPQPKSPDKPVLTGELTLVAGVGHTPDYSLPSGAYQLSWTIPGGVPKQKSFRIDCPIKDDGGHKKPSGAVAAGGGGVPAEPTAAGKEEDAPNIAGPLLLTAAVGAAGAMIVRRVRRRSHGAA